MLLPEPLSPTRPKHSPGSRLKLTSSTTVTDAARRRDPGGQVADVEEGAHRQPSPRSQSATPSPKRLSASADDDDGEAGQRHHPPGGEDEALALGDHGAPVGVGGCTPRPRKLKVIVDRITSTMSVMAKMIGRRDDVGQDVAQTGCGRGCSPARGPRARIRPCARPAPRPGRCGRRCSSREGQRDVHAR